MTPLYFGIGEHRLFGIYRPGRNHARAVVLCHPWGQEYIRAHRSMRRLAIMLNAAGRHVLSFDYFGTGDSAGEMSEATLDGWERDIEAAIGELKDISGAPRVTLVGIRLGAALAARVAVRMPADVEALCLWDPVVSGEGYLEELRAIEIAQTGRAPRGQEFLGFRMTDSMTNAIAAFDLVKLLQAFPQHAQFVTTTSLPSYATLRNELKKLNRPGWQFEHIASVQAWRQNGELGAGAVPVKVLETIVQRLQ